MGRAASANSYLGSAVLAVGALKALQPSDTRDRLLGRCGVRVPSGCAVALEPFEFVPDAEGADRVLVVADGGVAVADRDRDAATGRSTKRAGWPPCRRADDGSEVLRFDGDPAAAVRRLRDRAAVAIACDSLGLSEAMLVRDGRLREGAPAVRPAHRLVPGGQARLRRHAGAASRSSRQLVDAAVASRRATGRTPAWRPRWRSRTPAAAAVDIAGKAMQLHGGIGYTWESGIHVYLKRAALNRSLFGSPAAHRKELAKRYRIKGVSHMGVPVYKRILDLFEAEGVNTLFGIPDPNFVHMFAEADARGWSVVAPHHELSAGFMAEAVVADDRRARPVHRHPRARAWPTSPARSCAPRWRTRR